MISYRRLKPTQFEEWIDHCALVFSASPTEVEGFREYFRRHFLNDPNRNLSDIFVALDDDKIIGTVRLFKRSIYLHGEVVKTGGIGEVSVNRNYEKKGIATNLLNLVLEEMASLNIKLAILFASRYSFYERFGFKSINYQYYKHQVMANDKTYKFRQATILDSKLLTKLYDDYASKINGPIKRNLYYFENWVKDEIKDLYIVENENEEAIAYISGYEKDDTLIIKEFAKIESADFMSIANDFAANFYQHVKHISYPAMFHQPTHYDEKVDIPHLMAKVISPLSNKIQSTPDLKEDLESSRFGYYETDSF